MSKNTQSRKAGLLEFGRFAIRNAGFFRASRKKNAARANLCLANMHIGRMDIADPLRATRIDEFDRAMIELYKGKWFATEASRTGAKETWSRSFAAFANAERIGRALYSRLLHHSQEPVPLPPIHLESKGTEITFADGVPLVPAITPVVVLQGSDFEMGRQYAKQLVEIFGGWILARHTGRRFTSEERAELARWEQEQRKYTPWLLAFCKGWSVGASESGIAMSYEEALDRWVGHRPPASDYLGSGGLPEIPPMACSGVAAWGRATSDGHLVTGSTGDHDLSYQVTIVAFPDEGNSFIYSPFGATGEIAGAGDVYFFGHPAINDKGLAYVHHGGGPKFLEAKRHWGYGIRRAASVIHILRFCDTAREARAMEQSWPIGDVGYGDQNTVGGFWADDGYGFVTEGRKDPIAIREAGLLGERDFLYANNSVAHPSAMESEWLAREKDQWIWDEHGGWRPRVGTGMRKSLGLVLAWASGRLSTSDLLSRGMRYAYGNSCARNRYLFEMMDRNCGRIDLEYMKEVYRRGGSIPPGSWRKIESDFVKHGIWGDVSTAHSSNAMTVVTKPSEGLYCLCTGPARRGLAPMMPSSAITIYGETNAFWEIRLASTPEEVARDAMSRALGYLERARHALSRVPVTSPAFAPLQQHVALAQNEMATAATIEAVSISALAHVIRCATRAQVLAQQTLQALDLHPEPIAETKGEAPSRVRREPDLVAAH